MNDMVSIIMPSYNSEMYIADSIKTVVAQTYTNWELIIVDDCSTDKTIQIIESFHEPRIKLFSNEKNSGAAISRNLALQKATGKWIAFLDSDDWWHPQKLEIQLRFMEEKGFSFTCTDYRIKLNGQWSPYINTGPQLVNKRKMYNYCYFSTITVIYDQEKIGLIQIENLRKNNDYAMWLKAIEKSDCHRLSQCLSYYIKHDGSVSSGSKMKLIKWHYLLYRTGQHRNPFISSAFTVNNLLHGAIKKIFCKRKVNESDLKRIAETESIISIR